jgi:two-component system KDP operon response regulator KdpE
MSSLPTRILIVDDEPPIRRLLRTSLAAQGFQVTEAADGRQALAEIESSAPDLVILDLGLPDIQGQDLIHTLRQQGSSLPILVLSSRADEQGKVEALDLGADDYVTKPFGTDELFARIRTALRHRLQSQGELPVFRSGDLSVDLVRRIVTVREVEVKLSPKEYDIMRALVAHAGKVLTHRMLLN